MFEAIIVILIVLWLVGYRFKMGGNLIHTLLVIALVVLIVKMLT